MVTEGGLVGVGEASNRLIFAEIHVRELGKGFQDEGSLERSAKRTAPLTDVESGVGAS